MIASTQITNTEVFALITVLVESKKFIYKQKDNKKQIYWDIRIETLGVCFAHPIFWEYLRCVNYYKAFAKANYYKNRKSI